MHSARCPVHRYLLCSLLPSLFLSRSGCKKQPIRGGFNPAAGCSGGASRCGSEGPVSTALGGCCRLAPHQERVGHLQARSLPLPTLTEKRLTLRLAYASPRAESQWPPPRSASSGLSIVSPVNRCKGCSERPPNSPTLPLLPPAAPNLQELSRNTAEAVTAQ